MTRGSPIYHEGLLILGNPINKTLIKASTLEEMVALVVVLEQPASERPARSGGFAGFRF